MATMKWRRSEVFMFGLGLTILSALVLTSSVAAQSSAPNPLASIGAAENHMESLGIMLIEIHWRWKDVNAQAVDAYDAADAALDAANKCNDPKRAQALIDAANAKHSAAGNSYADAEAIQTGLLKDSEETVQVLKTSNGNVEKYASFARLQDYQQTLYPAAMKARTGLDPSDDPMTGLGLLTGARFKLQHAREALARCGGHAAASGSTLERIASRSVR
jgi:hypothetical protein